VEWSKFRTEDPQISFATLEYLDERATLRPGFVYSCAKANGRILLNFFLG